MLSEKRNSYSKMVAKAEPEVKERKPKRRVKRKVSELDPIAAKKRREQTRVAQRAFRRRQEEAIETLGKEVDHLNGIIEGLNNTFVSFTDVLAKSKWLEMDACMASELKSTIQTFLELTQSSPEPISRGEAAAPLHSASKHAAPNIVPENLTSPSSSSSPRPTNHEKIRGYSGSAIGSATSSSPQGRSTESTSAFGPTNTSSNFSSILSPSFSIPSPYLSLSAIQSMSWQTLPTNEVSFAGRLHRAAYEEGHRILCNWDRELYSYQQVFSYMLGAHTRDSLFWYLSKALNENLHGVLDPPEQLFPLADVTFQTNSWLNATEVYQYFRMNGIDFDDYPVLAKVEIAVDNAYDDVANNENTLDFSLTGPTVNLKTQTSNYSESFDFSTLISSHNRYQFGSDPKIVSRPAAVPLTRRVSVDVAKLISEIVLPSQTQCRGRNPVFRKQDLHRAMKRSVVQEL
ncbi:uncharacterized protein LY89DRAFT_781920 [Mollisia scopiformis]|uniref:BZIP domain-containing protein n=1 Tax=Mollisia scopiformis TaxID=149040 RepID=A0A194XC93_MOLSC|nr:uncharacterized protein LY89DRAFT_781920 [Mollisia scopiformis]KUJ17793.1 hypothetical protein LY89DRAFT_781920 [Mollisia scopiformis]